MVFNNGSQQQQQRQALTVPILLNSGSQHSGPLLCHVDMHYIYSNSITASAAEKTSGNSSSLSAAAASIAAGSNGANPQSLNIQITCSDVLSLHYSLSLSAQDFATLKNAQHLRIEFADFLGKMAELFSSCCGDQSDRFLCKLEHPRLSSVSSSTPSGSQSSLLNLDASSHSPILSSSSPIIDSSSPSSSSSSLATLSLIETNSFRHITHLSLMLVPANDHTLKTYLANLVKEERSRASGLETRLATTTTNLTAQLDASASSLTALTTQYDLAKQQAGETMHAAQILHAESMARERERAIAELEALKREKDAEKAEAEARWKEELSQITQKYTALNATHTHLLAHTQTLETALGAAHKHTDSLSRDLGVARDSLASTAASLRAADARIADLDSSMQRALSRAEVAEVDARAAREMGVEARRIEEEAKRNANDAGARADAFKARVDALEDGLRKAGDEIHKGNDIIRTLQSDLKTAKSKLKLKNTVTLQQETLLDERAATIEQLTRQLDAALAEKRTLVSTVEEEKIKNEDAAKRLEESRKVVEDNNHVIEWLHRQLNEEALGRPLGTATGAHVLGGLSGAVAGTGGFVGTIDFDKYNTNTNNNANVSSIPVNERKSPGYHRVARENQPPSASTATAAYISVANKYRPASATGGLATGVSAGGLTSSRASPMNHHLHHYTPSSKPIGTTTATTATTPNYGGGEGGQGGGVGGVGDRSPTHHTFKASTSNMASASQSQAAATTLANNNNNTNTGYQHQQQMQGHRYPPLKPTMQMALPTSSHNNVKSNYF